MKTVVLLKTDMTALKDMAAFSEELQYPVFLHHLVV